MNRFYQACDRFPIIPVIFSIAIVIMIAGGKPKYVAIGGGILLAAIGVDLYRPGNK